jgi:hypothetical protein
MDSLLRNEVRGSPAIVNSCRFMGEILSDYRCFSLKRVMDINYLF